MISLWKLSGEEGCRMGNDIFAYGKDDIRLLRGRRKNRPACQGMRVCGNCFLYREPRY